MAIISNKRSVMTLYSGATDIESHRVRIVLAEKGVSYDVIDVDLHGKPENLRELNPYGTVPTLVDRELALYESNIIAEYLDERFPHPPLMPVYPVARAKARLIIYRFQREWGHLVKQLEDAQDAEATSSAAKELASYLSQLVQLFNHTDYIMGEEFTLVDCYIAPVLWRLPAWGVSLSPSDNKLLIKYTNRVFQRDSFQASLTESEEELRNVLDQTG